MTELIDCKRVLTAEGWRRDVRLRLEGDGLIVALEPGTEPIAAPGAARLSTVLPGMPNVHSHGFQRLLAGLTGRRSAHGDSFWSWRQAMYAVAGRMDPERLETCLAGVYLAMLRGGFTSCAEFHYLHHATDGTPYGKRAEMGLRALEAAGDTGIGLTLLPVLYERSGFDASGVEARQRMFRNDPDAFMDLLADCRAAAAGDPRVRVGAAVHSLRAVRPESVLRLRDALPADCPLHIHVAEQPREVAESRERLGAPPLRWLLDKVGVDQRWCLVHATHAASDELEDAAAAGAVAGLCPSTEADLGDGVFDAPRWLGAAGRFGVGTDSNLCLSVADELRLLEWSQRLATGRRNVIAGARRSCGRRLYEDAAAGGGQALGQAVGRIAPGYRADLVELDDAHPLLDGLDGDALLDSFVFAGGADTIRSVWVAGRQLVTDGRHRDEERILPPFAALLREMRGVS